MNSSARRLVEELVLRFRAAPAARERLATVGEDANNSRHGS